MSCKQPTNGRWPAVNACWRSGLTDKAKLVFTYLALRRADQDGVAWPTWPTMEHDLNIQRRTLARVLSYLRSVGAIQIRKPGQGRGRRSLYVLPFSERWQGERPRIELLPIKGDTGDTFKGDSGDTFSQTTKVSNQVTKGDKSCRKKVSPVSPNLSIEQSKKYPSATEADALLSMYESVACCQV